MEPSQKFRCCPIQERPPNRIELSTMFDELHIKQQGENVAAFNAPDLFNAKPSNWLMVGYDGQDLQRRSAEFWCLSHLQSSSYRVCVRWCGAKLIRVFHLLEPDAPIACLIVLLQFSELYLRCMPIDVKCFANSCDLDRGAGGKQDGLYDRVQSVTTFFFSYPTCQCGNSPPCPSQKRAMFSPIA